MEGESKQPSPCFEQSEMKCLNCAAATFSKHWAPTPNLTVKHEELVFLCKALIGIPVCRSACEDAFIVLTQDSYSAFSFYVWFL